MECYLFLNQNITIYYNFLFLIGNKTIGNKEGRIEPRKIAQQFVKENGHPKKLK
jgi:hypothetical protein